LLAPWSHSGEFVSGVEPALTLMEPVTSMVGWLPEAPANVIFMS
jgi:hypothetical protein